jgi:tetratricopeptide (TPR) repeat protein
MSRAAASGPVPALAGSRRFDVGAIVLLLVLTAPWWIAIHVPLIKLDDSVYVSTNPDVLGGLNWHSFLSAFQSTRGSMWIPLTWISLSLDVSLFGAGPADMHATNVFFHVGNAILVYLFLRHATGAPRRSLLVAALWAMHPQRVESVAWVTERKDVLSGFFGLLALLAYLRYAKRPNSARMSLVVVLFALSLMAKAMLVTLPFLLLLLDLWPLKRSSSWRRLLLEKIPLFALAFVMTGLTYYINARDEVFKGVGYNPFTTRIQTAIAGYGLYLRDTFYFQELALYYPGHPPIPYQVAMGAVLLGSISIFAVVLWRKNPVLGRPFAVGWCWFLGLLVPTIGLTQAGPQARADRFTYFASIGLIIALVWCWPERWFEGSRRMGAWLMGAGAILFVAIYAILRLLFWQDPLVLYGSDIAHTGPNPVLEALAGDASAAAGLMEDAEAYYRLALRHGPRMGDVHHNLGDILMNSGRRAEGVEEFRKALEIDPRNAAFQRDYERAYRETHGPATASSSPALVP